MPSREFDDPLAVLGRLVHSLRNAIDGLSEAQLREREAPGKWSILEVMQHLADTELVCGWRVRLILTHDTPQIQGYDQDVWAQELRYNEMILESVFDQLRALRSVNLRLFRSLSAQQLDRCGIHSERGRYSIGTIIRALAEHDLRHVRQIERVKKTIL